MLRLESLSCGYGSVRAVQDVSFELAARSSLALLGPNGAGKTSTIMAIMGHTTIHGGRILFEGQDITHLPPIGRVDLGIALVPEGRRLFSDLSVEENLTVGGYRRSMADDRRNRERVYSLFPRLSERRKQVSGSLSGGEQQMLAMGRALMAEPKLLLIDELSLGLMPKMVDLCFDALTALKADGVTILLVEQNTSRALGFTDHVCIMTSGSLAFTGASADAQGNDELFDVFVNSPH
ncbi:ABC transporter ATP-binding protein [Bradyrhizobium sp. U87765 SZCCT0131]|uniref:ABC transporter ATP-binding protein n=1 Tax=unclassified Bradyrhizobium TaxID=2631580 RepID=UPI001BA9100A|nr:MULTISPECIES: ABC transporter ATP-binding protein [unclassified Bradyrhizobium]MBR1221630.1 ABC transporter ATP-binding protein [Bradyrhizobium sp. U87765 SZCCT0131]MBR1264447.1 ABC transporter ATP-binding protein [Bradyrhizobium sp. U87765 SZCCT0134]MBR1304646.1 ABC transporter ATP-binding protein [Bradyrhizobium sp. U87765 SZCCT0110]MBR1322497.1 ABC transporter ATP-binding protein [Bradyrhizobium sp. U87765 SZCCT0109]MBR1346575.1 ABC transporter ATP-binding protein [Bradyrhizobium sp. U87